MVNTLDRRAVPRVAFALRLPVALYAAVVQAAAASGRSMNEIITAALAEKLTE